MCAEKRKASNPHDLAIASPSKRLLSARATHAVNRLAARSAGGSSTVPDSSERVSVRPQQSCTGRDTGSPRRQRVRLLNAARLYFSAHQAYHVLVMKPGTKTAAATFTWLRTAVNMIGRPDHCEQR